MKLTDKELAKYVTDKASAEKAVTDIKAVVEEMKKIAARAKALGQPSADVKAKIEAKMKRINMTATRFLSSLSSPPAKKMSPK